MIIVTGSARSGASMAMQTLMHLGVNIVGEKFSDFNIPYCNEKGYYELPPDEISSGIKDNRYEGKAVKLFGQGLLKTVDAYINKLIICERNRNESVTSFIKLLASAPSVGIAATRKNSEKIIDFNRKIADAYASVCEKPVYKLSFKRMLYSTEKVVNELIEFLGINPTEEQIQDAISNIMRKEG